jgi:alkaline phosphatase
VKRRELIKGGLLAGVAGVLGTAAPARANGDIAPARRAPARRARNLIFYVYDGFGYEDLGTARFFAQRHQNGRTLTLERMLGRSSSGSMLPHSLTSVVTDSAAASTAWSTGRKVVNGALAMYPDARPLTTILELAREAGRATGLITTTRITHATPAGWIAKVPNRSMEDEIAVQYLDFAPELLLGGGSWHFDPAHRDDGRNLFADFQARGYSVLRTAEELQRTNGSRLLGTFDLDHLPFEIDRRFQNVASPSLAEMTRKGLEVLAGYDGGFVVQVEAGRIDHANHDNDPGGAVWDILAADDALDVILEFVDRHPDTLLIMASDHATGGGVVYGAGPWYQRSSSLFDRLALHRASYEHLLFTLGENPATEQIIAAVREQLGIPISTEQGVQIGATIEHGLSLAHPLAHRSIPRNAVHWLLTAGNPEDPEALNLNYATGAHTAGLVPVFRYGAGSGIAALGVVDNTELFAWMLDALGIRFENPVMTEQEALQLTAGLETPLVWA